MKRITIIVFICLFAKSTLCFSWGAKGHKIVAEIAKAYLDKKIQDSVQKYLGGMSFENAALWMDIIKSDEYYDYLKPLHYINIEKDNTSVKQDNNIVSELEFVIHQLKDKDKRGKEIVKMHLKMLFHLIGDLHQPLYVGYREDMEANPVLVNFNGKEINIQYLWDADIIETKNITLEDCLKVIGTYSEKEIHDIQNIDVVAWMNNSRSLLPDVYRFKNKLIDEEYVSKNVLIIEKQLANAGLRLAGILNLSFR